MPTQLLLTKFLNAHFAAPVTGLLHSLHIQPAYAEAPITNAVAMELLVFMLLVAYFVVVRVSLSVEKPGGVQHLAEMTHEFVSDQGESIIGHGFESFTGYLTALFLFILVSNLIGLVPGLESPTANVVVPLGPDRCLTIFEWYRRDPEAPGAAEAIARTIAFSHDIQLEDIGICEVVQKNLASGAYDRGRFSALRENGVHHFQSLVHAALTSEA